MNLMLLSDTFNLLTFLQQNVLQDSVKSLADLPQMRGNFSLLGNSALLCWVGGMQVFLN